MSRRIQSTKRVLSIARKAWSTSKKNSINDRRYFLGSRSDEYEVEEDDEDASQDAFASVVTRSCFDLVGNEDINWSFANKAEEYVASFGLSQFGIRYK